MAQTDEIPSKPIRLTLDEPLYEMLVERGKTFYPARSVPEQLQELAAQAVGYHRSVHASEYLHKKREAAAE